jgi:isoamylase
VDARGVDFFVYSSVAQAVQLCLFDPAGTETRLDLARSGDVWHRHAPGIRGGQRYGYRVTGPFDPSHNLRCNPAKLLLDPYAKAVAGDVRWDPAVFGYAQGSGADPDLVPNDSDSAGFVPRSVVVDDRFDWGLDAPPRRPFAETVIYEAHVRGLTMRHPEVPANLRGTYAGLATKPVTDYLSSLGVTAVELMPVQHFIDEQDLVQAGRRDYWGYNPLCYFAPAARYASSGDGGEQVVEFKQMVKALHAAGLEVILDVVFNHTCEGNHLGPTLCYKGLDSPAYYRAADNPRYMFDVTWTGNSLNVTNATTLQLLIDCLRYWVDQMHVDGFRFDESAELADTVAMGGTSFSPDSAFFERVSTDALLSGVKLIAEPWDTAESDLGRYPSPWSEWNGAFRDTVRAYWRSVDGTLGPFATALMGSSDLYRAGGRATTASVNYVVSHDGYTLRDLVSHTDPARGAWDCGGDASLQAREQRNLLTTVMLSQGVPMVLSGDECGRTQNGEPNAYDLDDETSWFDWGNADTALLAFVRRVIALRRQHPVFRRRTWVAEGPESAWYRPDGGHLTQQDWHTAYARSVALLLNGEAIPETGPDGEPVTDDTFLLLFNAHWDPLEFTLPAPPGNATWSIVLDTEHPEAPQRTEPAQWPPGAKLSVGGRALIVMSNATEATAED